MIQKKDIIKMAKQVFRKTQGYPDRRIMHPYREWGIGILVFALLVVAGGVVAGKVFVSYLDIDATDVQDAGTGIPRYREALVQDAIEMYQQKNDAYQAIEQTITPVENNSESDAVETDTEDVADTSEESPNTVTPGELIFQ